MDGGATLRGVFGSWSGNQLSPRMMPELRHVATDADWAAYHAIRRRVLFELRGIAGYDENHPDDRRSGHHPFLLWDAGTPIGTIRVDIDRECAIFRRVAIREDLQRRGHGRQLLQAAEDFARRQHCTRVESHVDPGAVGFYERCGYSFANPAGAGRAPLMFKTLASDRAE